MASDCLDGCTHVALRVFDFWSRQRGSGANQIFYSGLVSREEVASSVAGVAGCRLCLRVNVVCRVLF